MLSCRTKLENCEALDQRVAVHAEYTYIIVFEVRAENGSTELCDVRDDEAGTEFSPADELGRLGVGDHPWRCSHKS